MPLRFMRILYLFTQDRTIAILPGNLEVVHDVACFDHEVQRQLIWKIFVLSFI